MKLDFENEGIDIISGNNDLMIYQTVDEELVFYANSKNYKQTFKKNSSDIIESKIYIYLNVLMNSIIEKYNLSKIKEGKFKNFDNKIIEFYSTDGSNLLRLARTDNELTLELIKMKENSNKIIKTGKLEFEHSKCNCYELLLFDFYKTLARCTHQEKAYQKVYKSAN